MPESDDEREEGDLNINSGLQTAQFQEDPIDLIAKLLNQNKTLGCEEALNFKCACTVTMFKNSCKISKSSNNK